jgi:hypothetical protein
VPKSVAEKFIAEDKPGKLPYHVKRADGGLAAAEEEDGLAQGGLSTATDLHQAREINMPNGGFLHSSIAGRTDRIPATVPPNSFILPADVVSGAGQGNSLAGANILSEALKLGPYGTKLPAHSNRAAHLPNPPHLAKGGDSDAKVLLAGGELAVPPWRVEEIGEGDINKGHEAMRKLVDVIRKFASRPLPPPKRKDGGTVGLDA